MTTNTKEIIETTTKRLFAEGGYEGFSMRALCQESKLGLSSVYHFFPDKDALLKHIFNTTNTDLGKKRLLLPRRTNASKLLYDRIVFQFENIEDIIFVLKYYLHFRSDFVRLNSGFFPSKAYLHIEEVLVEGIADGEFSISASRIEEEAKVITHAINGFLLEYYPDTPDSQELRQIVKSIHTFLIRSLTNKEAPM